MKEITIDLDENSRKLFFEIANKLDCNVDDLVSRLIETQYKIFFGQN